MDGGILRAAERALGAEFGGRVRLAPVQESGGAAPGEWRCAVRPARADLPEVVTVRALRAEGEEPFSLREQKYGAAGARFLRHAAGSRFLARLLLDPLPAPRLLAAAPRQGLLVLDEVSGGEGIACILNGEDPDRAEAALGRYVRALARVAAQSAGHESEYEDIFHSFGGRRPAADLWRDSVRNRISRFDGAFEELEIEWTPALVDDVQTVAAAVLTPGPWLAYSPGGLPPAGVNVVDGDVVVFDDPGGGGFRHALLDAAYPRLAFGNSELCGRVPPGLVRDLEDEYRALLSTHIPLAADKRAFRRAMLDATAYWLLEIVAENLAKVVRFDRTHGEVSLRQRVLFALDAFALEGAEVNYLWDLGYFCRLLHDKLSARWPGLAPMPFYPAFRGGT